MKTRIGILAFYNEGYSPEVLKNRIRKNIVPIKENSLIDVIFEGEVTDYGSARKISLQIKDMHIDCLVVIIASWTESRCVFENIQYFFHKPILLWSTTGIIDAEGVLNSPAPIGGIAPIVADLRYFTDARFKYIRDSHEKGIAVCEALDFIQSCGSLSRLKNMRICILGLGIGHTYTFNFDSISIEKLFGIQVEEIDILEIVNLIRGYTEKYVRKETALFEENFDLRGRIDASTLLNTVKVYKALSEIIENYSFDALMLNCFQFGDVFGTTLCLPFTMLGEVVPCKGGSDVMSAVTQLILRELSGKVTTYLEVFEQLDSRRLLMSSCGYAPKSLCIDEKVLCGQGKWGDTNLPGIKNCSLMKEGLITLARLSYKGSSFIMHLAKGNATKPRPFRELDMHWNGISKMPCTPGLELELLTSSADDFLNAVVSSHYDVVYGDYIDRIVMFCELANIPYII